METYKGLEITKELGRGRYATVSEVKHPDITSIGPFALKQYISQPELAAKEAGALARMQHPNIIKLVHFDKESNSLLLEKADMSLRQYMKDHPRSMVGNEWQGGKIEIAKQIIEGLAYAHSKGIIHKDLKPENILLKISDPIQVKLTDFNQSKDLETIVAPDMVLSGNLSGTAGTKGYTAPEGSKDARSDVFSAGLILYELFTSQLPQGKFKNVSEISGSAPEWIDEVVNCALAQDTYSRYTDAGRMLDAIYNFPKKPVRDAQYDLSDEKNLKMDLLAALNWTGKAAWFALKYTIGLPLTIGDGIRHAYHGESSWNCSRPSCGACAAVVAITLGGYLVPAVTTPIVLNNRADSKLEQELKTLPPKGRIVFIDENIGRISYVRGNDLRKVTTFAEQFDGIQMILPSTDGRHVYLLQTEHARIRTEEEKSKNALIQPEPGAIARVDIDTGKYEMLTNDGARTILKNVNKFSAITKDNVETLYVQIKNDWFMLRENWLDRVSIVTPELNREASAGNISPDGKYQLQLDGGNLSPGYEVQIVRASDEWFADYELAMKSGSAIRPVWLPESSEVKTPQPVNKPDAEQK